MPWKSTTTAGLSPTAEASWPEGRSETSLGRAVSLAEILGCHRSERRPPAGGVPLDKAAPLAGDFFEQAKTVAGPDVVNSLVQQIPALKSLLGGAA
ncbi:MAG: hypothetical protein PHC88_08015 [Terrimicrobiaceae bacterium]|nr:hypothetical protein [Terrimicrobiaceae bacterium]